MKKNLRKKARVVKKSTYPKTIWFYLRAYFVAIVVGIIVFAGTSHFFKPPIPCANSGSCTSDLTLKIQNGAIGMFEGHKVIPPFIAQTTTPSLSVLGANVPGGEKHIYVDLKAQVLYAYQGNVQILRTFISSGKWGPTPVGNFNIWEKLVSTRMSGGEGASAYDLPNVPYVMYFYHDWGLHGAYWHDNFGHPMSHGCVNMRTVDAKVLFDWSDGPSNGKLGTPVSVCNSFTAPGTCVQDNSIN